MESICRQLKFLFFFALNIVLASPVSARPGETITQCDKRYGKPLFVRDNLRIYEKAGVGLGVFFHDGVAWQVIYSHQSGAHLTGTEKKAILGAYGKWVWTNEDATGKAWRSPDRSLIAMENNVNGTLAIMSSKGADKADADVSRVIRQSL